MTIKEFYEKYGDVELTEEQVKHVKDLLDIKENKKWKPKKREKYYYINGSGSVDSHTFDNDIVDERYISFNNCFKTEEEAKYRVEQIKVYNELKNFADENNEEIDLNNYNVKKYVIECDLEDKEVHYDWYTSIKSIGQIYFSSKELVEQAIEKVGADRIKKYLFGVK